MQWAPWLIDANCFIELKIPWC